MRVGRIRRTAAPTNGQEDPLMTAKIEALGPVLDKLKGLDSKAFGALSGMISQAEEKH